MNRITLHDWIVLFQFDPLGRIFLVLNGDIAAGAWQPRSLMLGAFQNHLNAVSFFAAMMLCCFYGKIG